jgi:hypothetical protein
VIGFRLEMKHAAQVIKEPHFLARSMHHVFVFLVLLLLGTAFLQLKAEEIPSMGSWAEAARAIVRLPPATFPSLPSSIRTWLAHEGYAVPQSCATKPHTSTTTIATAGACCPAPIDEH